MFKKILALVVALAAAGASYAQAATFSPVRPAAFTLGFAQSRHLIGAAMAEAIALKFVGGGRVILTQLDNQPLPLHYSVDILQPKYEFEVWVDAVTGKVLKVIRQLR